MPYRPSIDISLRWSEKRLGVLCIWVDEGTRVGWLFRLFIRVIRVICLIRDSDIFRLHNPNPINFWTLPSLSCLSFHPENPDLDNLMRQIFSTYSTTHCTPLERGDWRYRLSIHMSPLWGFGYLRILRCYKHAAPLGLGWVIGEHLSESRIDAD